jgi:hypothetical protein
MIVLSDLLRGISALDLSEACHENTFGERGDICLIEAAVQYIVSYPLFAQYLQHAYSISPLCLMKSIRSIVMAANE